ncbi:uncharacterized protein LOC123510944 [Portunus trituberculatus]|uniref:uncharacterized protein LOC123510944 n=1 Tax=Portunus trituberculatus TaxID=210409 RepID=UPI001E1CE299|nr:uncharacterized protein LOC123510944 [Portunus trituberculatus]
MVDQWLDSPAAFHMFVCPQIVFPLSAGWGHHATTDPVSVRVTGRNESEREWIVARGGIVETECSVIRETKEELVIQRPPHSRYCYSEGFCLASGLHCRPANTCRRRRY